MASDAIADFSWDLAPYELPPGIRRMITLRRPTRDRIGGEESVSRNSRRFSSGLVDEPSTTRSARMRSRTDVHNAFLLGPSLMSVLGSLCGYWGGPAKEVLEELSSKYQSPEGVISATSWWIFTLPGSLLAMVLSCAYISRSQVHPHEPETTSEEQSTTINTALLKLEDLGHSTLPIFTCIACTFIFCILLVPVVLLGLEVRVALLGMLPSVALLVTSLRCRDEGRLSGSHKTWSEIPWGIVFLFGSVQVASKLVQTCDLLGEIFEHFDRKFWVRTSPLGVQMILATMASLLAEITDKRKLVQGMMPIVSNIATFKNMYPTYYAIPVIVGAFSNLIMPASVPLVILHEVARVSFLKLFILGLLLKLLIITMVLITVNSAGKMIYGLGKAAI